MCVYAQACAGARGATPEGGWSPPGVKKFGSRVSGDRRSLLREKKSQNQEKISIPPEKPLFTVGEGQCSTYAVRSPQAAQNSCNAASAYDLPYEHRRIQHGSGRVQLRAAPAQVLDMRQPLPKKLWGGG